MRRALWHRLPHVRSGDDLTTGERAADELKRGFGSWPFLFVLNGIFFVWVALHAALNFDNGLLMLNLCLSWLAAQQGGALQIAANRGDRISSELALSTHANGEELLTLNRQQMEILGRLDGLSDQMAEVRLLVKKGAP